MDSFFSKQWLQRRVVVGELERFIQDVTDIHPSKPFSVTEQERLDKLRAFRKNIEEGFELWWFRSPQDDWDKLMGFAGFAVVLGDDVLDYIITERN